MAYMTFEAFQATRQPCADLGARFSYDNGEGEIDSGFVYDDCCYIENNTRKPELGKYFLCMERSDWISDDLGKLEAMLFTGHWIHEGTGEGDVILTEADDSVNDFIRTYCRAWDIRCDGDAFGLYFSGADKWTASEAIKLIKAAADQYGLRMSSNDGKPAPSQVPNLIAGLRAAFNDLERLHANATRWSQAEPDEEAFTVALGQISEARTQLALAIHTAEEASS
jgi:hypothetical protein